MILLTLLSAHALALDPPQIRVERASPTVERAVVAALALQGEPYRWGGRDTAKNPGIDCLGLLFRGFGAATGTPWTAYPVNPSELVSSGLLGQPAPGLDGVLRADLRPDALRRGDVLYLLLEEVEIPDAPLWERDGRRYWPWHTGLALGGGDALVVHARPGDEVTVQPLAEIAFDALYVTRTSEPVAPEVINR